jgi:hypothetical protein
MMAEHERDANNQTEFHNLLGDMMYTIAQRRANSQAAAHLILSFLMAPILTTSTSL